MTAIVKSVFYLILVTLLIVCCGGVASYALYLNTVKAIEDSKNDKKKYLEYQNAITARNLEENFAQIYHGIRSISKLPSVRQINRHATNLSRDDRITIQELYNNLASSAAMSEVYIISKEFNPDAMDNVTGKLEEPNIMFDQLIVGRTADDYLHLEEENEEESSEVEEAEEVETYEYQFYPKQIAWFQKNFPEIDKISGLDVPALTGKEVITCDNSRYSPLHPNDEDRSGLLYSVPFYGFDGEFRGIVSGIFLTHALRDLLPSGSYVLINKHYGQKILAHEPDEGLETSEQFIDDATPDPNRIFSVTTPLEIVDGDSEWVLWAGFPDVLFTEDVSRIKQEYYVKQTSIVGVVGIALLVLFRLRAGVEHEKEELIHLKEAAEEASIIKSRFLANMSHEIRTPMNGIMGMLELLMNTDMNDKQKKYTNTAYNCSQDMLTLVNDILDFSKIEAGEMVVNFEEFDLVTMLNNLVETYRPLADKKRIELKLELGVQGSGKLLGDALRIRQVLTNLVGNAIKFTQEGCVTIRVSMKAKHHGLADVCFEVVDTGIGIQKNKQHLLFTKFSQVDITTTKKYGGTGLGLAISKSLVEIMGGKIGVNSDIGQGATFWFSLPMQQAG